MSSSSSEDELSHFKPSGLLYSQPKDNTASSSSNSKTTSINNTKNERGMLKYYECEDSCDPSQFPSRDAFKLFVFKDSSVVDTIDLSTRSYYRLGRDPTLNHLTLLHESISSQHAVLQYRLRDRRCRLYLMDLDSANGTTINGEAVVVEGKRFYEILDGDVVKFGASTRDYVFMKKTD